MSRDYAMTRSIVLPQEVTEATERLFATALSELLAQQPPEITLDCSGVVGITAPHLKLLQRVWQHCDQRGIALIVKSAPVAMQHVLQRLNLSEPSTPGPAQASAAQASADPWAPAPEAEGYEDEFAATARGIREALEHLLLFMRGRVVPRHGEYILRTIFYEVTTNIRLHARLGPDDRIAFAVVSDRDGVRMTFRDGGAPFDLTDYRPQPATASSPEERRSFGIIMIRTLADRVCYRRENDTHNVLTVERRWGNSHA